MSSVKLCYSISIDNGAPNDVKHYTYDPIVKHEDCTIRQLIEEPMRKLALVDAAMPENCNVGLTLRLYIDDAPRHIVRTKA